jgi:hypothetical protein
MSEIKMWVSREDYDSRTGVNNPMREANRGRRGIRISSEMPRTVHMGAEQNTTLTRGLPLVLGHVQVATGIDDLHLLQQRAVIRVPLLEGVDVVKFRAVDGFEAVFRR